jgi:hypothetical protein
VRTDVRVEGRRRNGINLGPMVVESVYCNWGRYENLIGKNEKKGK